ncbi:MAG TPA: DUF4268 domain-containing protein, partial [Aquaticitalea sp.]|nr:DUF4268 domain-containing protein [Aquaticitalea sp.]
NVLNKIFMTLYSEIDTEDYLESLELALVSKKGNSRFPNDEEIRTALRDKDMYNINPKNRSYFFELLENHNNREHVDTSHEGITVEHIFPQNPGTGWDKSLGEEEYFMFKEKFLNTISNLTLSGNNGALGNKTFLEKKHMNKDNGNQGYLYSRLWLNDYLKNIDIWNKKSYGERLDLITDRFFEIWDYPVVEIQTNGETIEQNIFEADSPRHKKLEYFIFKNNKIEEPAIANMTTYVLRELYTLNPELFLGNGFLTISRNREEFRSPQEISNGYYIELNNDSDSKFNTIKKMLTLYDLEEELMIKYDLDVMPHGNRFLVRREFWTQLLPLIKETKNFSNVSPSKTNWITAGAGKSGIGYVLVVTKSFYRIELALNTANKDTNKSYFKKLSANRTEIEQKFGKPLIWEELPDKKMSRIKIELDDFDLYNKVDWRKANEFFVEHLPKFVKAFEVEISKL